MRQAVLRFVAVVAVGLIVLAGVLYVATTVDARAPEVTGFRLTQSLPDDETRALTTTSLEVVFSESVETASAEGAFGIEPAVQGTFAWSGATMVFTPAERLPLETEFTVTISAGVRDPQGNVMDQAADAFRFTTVGRPQVIGSEPDPGATAVPLDAALTITFSRLMDTASVEEALAIEPAVPLDVRWSGEALELAPSRALEPGQEYSVVVGGDATDLAGTPLGEPFELSFETVAAGLDPVVTVPAPRSEGIAVTSTIALVFDRPLDPESVDDETLSVEPEVAGALEIAPPEGALALNHPNASVLRFIPAGPLPPNTTFSVELAASLRSSDGAQLAEPLAWTFTTGAPLPTLGNQIVFLSDRSGVTNLWAMNPVDGSNQRQLSSELAPVVSYAVSPDGRSFVVGDGTRLVQQQSDGGGRQVLTGEGLLEFDPAYSPDGRRLAFARADAATGRGLGIWQRPALGGDAELIELPQEVGVPPPSPGGADDERLLRAPRYSPDGSAVAFVDAAGRIGIIEMPSLRITTVAFVAVGPPAWLPNSSGILVSGVTPENGGDPPGTAPTATAPVLPLDPTALELPGAFEEVEVVRFPRSGTSVLPTGLDERAVRCSVAADGRVACIRLASGEAAGGTPIVATTPGEGGSRVEAEAPLVAHSVAFTPEEETLLIGRLRDAGDARSAGIWLVTEGRATQLADDGHAPLWLP